MIVFAFKWFIFFTMAFVSIGASLMMVTRRNPIHSALWLILSFCSLAGIYALLNATFVALAQVMVYAGAIMMLVLFVIMLIHLETPLTALSKRSFPKLLGSLITIMLFTQLLGGILAYRAVAIKPAVAQSPLAQLGNGQALGALLYGKYVFPFEIASILLLVGIIGAVVLAKRVKE